MDGCLCLFSWLVQVNPTLCGQNVPTKLAISEILVHVEKIVGPCEENGF